jgi:hypothetical protein
MGSKFDNSIYWIISHVVTTIRYYTFKIAVSMTQAIITFSRLTHQLLNCLEQRLRDESSNPPAYDSWTESESYITTDGQSTSLSWNKAPIWGLWPDFYYCQTVASLLIWGALSDERTGVSFTISAGLASAVILGAQSLGTREHISLLDFPFRRLVRLAGLRWKYSTPPPHGSTTELNSV